MHEVLVNSLGGLNLARKSVVRLTDCPDMTLAVYRGRKPTEQQQGMSLIHGNISLPFSFKVLLKFAPHHMYYYLKNYSLMQSSVSDGDNLRIISHIS